MAVEPAPCCSSANMRARAEDASTGHPAADAPTTSSCAQQGKRAFRQARRDQRRAAPGPRSSIAIGLSTRSIGAASTIGRDRTRHTAHWRSTEGEPVVQRFTRALAGASSGRAQRPVTNAVSRATRRRARTTGVMAGVATVVALAAPGIAGATVNAPAHIISFPSRDFVSATGYDLNKLYTVEVQHPDGTVAGTVTDLAPKDDGEGGGLGIIEINHPGGYCWVGVTPDIRPGDTVRIKSQDATPTVDESMVRNVTATRPVQTGPGTVQIHGTAQDPTGAPLPVGELEQRLVVPGDAFAINGRRTLRATNAGGV